MDLLERLLKHDEWTTRHLLERSRSFADAELDQVFDIGHETLRLTFVHIIDNMETWTDLISEQPQREATQPPAIANSIPGLIARLDVVAPEFAALAQRLQAEKRWDELWTDYLDKPPTQKTFGGAVAHLLTHSMFHRNEVLHIMKRLGMTDLIEGDVLSWEAQHRATQRF